MCQHTSKMQKVVVKTLDTLYTVYIREHRQKISSRLADVGCEGGGGAGLSESVKKGKFVFFQIMLNEVLKICEK